MAGGEIKMHVFAPLTGKEERFKRRMGWFQCFNLASKRGQIVA